MTRTLAAALVALSTAPAPALSQPSTAAWEGCLHATLDALEHVPDALAAYGIAEARCASLEPPVETPDAVQVREGAWTRAVTERGGRP